MLAQTLEFERADVFQLARVVRSRALQQRSNLSRSRFSGQKRSSG
jgi:hypothetical protein